MEIIGTIKFTYKNKKYSKIAFDSLEIDNKNFLTSKLKDNEIYYQINSDKLGTFLTTTDDLISSEIVAEKIINNTR